MSFGGPVIIFHSRQETGTGDKEQIPDVYPSFRILLKVLLPKFADNQMLSHNPVKLVGKVTY